MNGIFSSLNAEKRVEWKLIVGLNPRI